MAAAISMAIFFLSVITIVVITMGSLPDTVEGLYVGLAATWGIFGVLAFSNPRGSSVGLGFEELSVLEYAMTQCKIIVSSYLKLSFWPSPLVFDYGWPIVRDFGQVVPYALVLAVLLILGLVLFLVSG